MAKATFAAGCFWGVQLKFSRIPGVLQTNVGYTGGKTSQPTYETVCRGDTYHAEAIEIEFDPERISYRNLVDIFFMLHDPTTPNRQGPDFGSQYRSAIFFHDQQQESEAKIAIDKLTRLNQFSAPIVTQIEKAGTFHLAEAYHQNYLVTQNKRQ